MKTGLLCNLLALASAKKPCTLPSGTEGADDGNPHCWDRLRRCDGPNAHPDGGPGYSPSCGACEGIGGYVWGDEANKVTIPKCTALPSPAKNDTQPVPPGWAMMGKNGKFTIENDRFTMIGKKTDPFCFSFFPSNNSVGNQCYRRQTGKFQVDMSKEEKSVRYDLQIHIPWPSDKFSLFGNISTTIFHHGPNMWVVNDLYGLMKQCVCIQPLSTAAQGGPRNPDPIYPVMHNWTNHLTYLSRERLEIEYGIGEMDVDHWVYGPHHAWTPVGSDQIVRMWQPYNGFEVFEPGSIKPGVITEEDFENMVPPPLCKKGGALMRITCTDDGFPVPENATKTEAIAEAADLRRSRTKVPRSSHKGSSFQHMAETLNGFVRQYGNVKECADWTTQELQRFQGMMLMLRSTSLNDLYLEADDTRALRGDEDAHGQRWERLNALAHEIEGGLEVQRDGHCHEAVMWFVHHVPETVRNTVGETMALPLLPYTQHNCGKHEVCKEYLKQVSCQDCHRDADIPDEITV